MELMIFGDEKKEDVVRLRLEYGKFGDVYLVACDEKGRWIPAGCILCITKKGRVQRSFNVNKELGFKLDDEGRIQIHI